MAGVSLGWEACPWGTWCSNRSQLPSCSSPLFQIGYLEGKNIAEKTYNCQKNGLVAKRDCNTVALSNVHWCQARQDSALSTFPGTA